MALTKKALESRRLFVTLYGTSVRNVVSYIARGWDSDRIATRLGTSVSSVAAVRANVTRGTYGNLITGNVNSGFTGSCKF